MSVVSIAEETPAPFREVDLALKASRRLAGAGFAGRARAEARDHRDFDPLGQLDAGAPAGMFAHDGDAPARLPLRPWW